MPTATGDVVAAVAVGQQAAVARNASPVSSSVCMSDRIGVTRSACKCCDSALGYAVYLTSNHPAFTDPKWQGLKAVLSGQRPYSSACGCPSVARMLDEFVSIAGDITMTSAPIAELRELENRLQTADAQVSELQQRTERLQKLLDNTMAWSVSSPRQIFSSEHLSNQSVNSSSVVAWLDLASTNSTSSHISDTESDHRLTGTSSRQAGENEITEKISKMIAEKQVELTQLRAEAVIWDNKLGPLREKQAEIETLLEALTSVNCQPGSVEFVNIPETSEDETSTATAMQALPPPPPPLTMTNEEISNRISLLKREINDCAESISRPRVLDGENQTEVPWPIAELTTTLKNIIRKLSGDEQPPKHVRIVVFFLIYFVICSRTNPYGLLYNNNNLYCIQKPLLLKSIELSGKENIVGRNEPGEPQW